MSRPFTSRWILFTHYADFRGRATRTDLISFWIDSMIVGFVILAPAILFGDWQTQDLAQVIYALVILCPSAALFARRLHDQGRSGWWALVAIPVLIVSMYEAWQSVVVPYYVAVQSTEVLIVTAISLGLTGLLFFLPDQEGPNRYGPNPREVEPEGTA